MGLQNYIHNFLDVRYKKNAYIDFFVCAFE